MAKRGQRLPWRVQFFWDHPMGQPDGRPIGGIDAYPTFAQALSKRDDLIKRAQDGNPERSPLSVAIYHVDDPADRSDIRIVPEEQP